MNYFESRSAARRYARYRPNFHPLVVDRIRARLGLQRPVRVAVDIGCGPGQSTVALRRIASQVIGIDISAGMLAAAAPAPGIRYVQGPAEQLPLRDGSADLLTTSLAFHWFDPARFFCEARRVLRDRGWLVISNNGFTGQVMKHRQFEPWFRRVYLRRYPGPPRNTAPMTDRLARGHGFHFAGEEEYQNEVRFTAEEWSAYLTTQSNVIAATEQGGERVEDVFHWIIDQTGSLFKTERPAFAFSGYIWYLQKMS